MRIENVDLKNVNQKLKIEIENIKFSKKEKNVMSQAQLFPKEKAKELLNKIGILSDKSEALLKELD